MRKEERKIKRKRIVVLGIRQGAVFLQFHYMVLCSMRKEEKKNGRRSPRWSFLSVSLYGTMRKKKNSVCVAFAKVQFSYSFCLWYYEKSTRKKI